MQIGEISLKYQYSQDWITCGLLIESALGLGLGFTPTFSSNGTKYSLNLKCMLDVGF